jgi:hypothetical protein
VRAAAASLLMLLLAGCSGAPMASSAAGCWGSGAVGSAAACQEALGAALAALGHRAPEGLEAARVGGVCGGFIDCAEAVRSTPPPPRPTPRPVAARQDDPPAQPTPRRDTAGGDPVARPTPLGAAATPTPVLAEAATPPPAGGTQPPPTPTPVSVTEETIATSSSNACAGVTISALESKGKLTDGETRCAMDAAMGRAGVSSSDVQSAAIALRNSRAKGWQDAVEAALKQGSNGNAPLLNFAGIEPAYNGKRYTTVLKRARIVWQNRGKGYQFGAKDLDFIVEFSCRSAGQLALAGKPADDGLDWCERWLDRAEGAGKPTQEIEDLIRQVE